LVFDRRHVQGAGGGLPLSAGRRGRLLPVAVHIDDPVHRAGALVDATVVVGGFVASLAPSTREPAAVALVTVTLTDSAFAAAGMPHVPAVANTRTRRERACGAPADDAWNFRLPGDEELREAFSGAPHRDRKLRG